MKLWSLPPPKIAKRNKLKQQHKKHKQLLQWRSNEPQINFSPGESKTTRTSPQLCYNLDQKHHQKFKTDTKVYRDVGLILNYNLSKNDNLENLKATNSQDKGGKDLGLSIFNKCKQNLFVQIQLNKCDKCNVI